MALTFPNPSRYYDETMHAIRFWGHDGAISFFVDQHVLTKMQPGATDEAALLAAFDANRELIHRTAIKVYGRGRKGAYDLRPSDL
jgi:Protein of unknown function (DUF1488)